MTDTTQELTLSQILELPVEQCRSFLSRGSTDSVYDHMWREKATDPKAKCVKGARALANINSELEALRERVRQAGSLFSNSGSEFEIADRKPALARMGWDSEFAWPIDWINDTISGDPKVIVTALIPDISIYLNANQTALQSEEIPVEVATQIRLLRLFRRMTEEVTDLRIAVLVADTNSSRSFGSSGSAGALIRYLLNEGVLGPHDRPGNEFTLTFYSDAKHQMQQVIAKLWQLYPECMEQKGDQLLFRPPHALLNVLPLRDYERSLLEDSGIVIERNGLGTMEVFDATRFHDPTAAQLVHIHVCPRKLRFPEHVFDNDVPSWGEVSTSEWELLQEQTNTFVLASALYDISPHSWHSYFIDNEHLSPDECTLLAGEDIQSVLTEMVREDTSAARADVMNPNYYVHSNYGKTFAEADQGWMFNQTAIYAAQFHILPSHLPVASLSPEAQKDVMQAIFLLPESELVKAGIFRRTDVSVAIIGSGTVPLHAILLAPYASTIDLYDPSEINVSTISKDLREGISTPKLPWHNYAKAMAKFAPGLYSNAIPRVTNIAQAKVGSFKSLAGTMQVGVSVGPFSLGSVERKGSKAEPLRHMGQILQTVELGGIVTVTISGTELAWLSDAHTAIASTGLADEKLVAEMFEWVGGRVIDCRRHDELPGRQNHPGSDDFHVVDVTVINEGTPAAVRERQQRLDSSRSVLRRRLCELQDSSVYVASETP